MEANILDLNDFDLPLYSPDLQNAKGIPEDVHRLHALIGATDGIVLSLAEYNGAYSTAFKNVFDWLSRINKKVWQNKPMLLMSTSPGGRGGKGVMGIALNSFPYYGGNIIAHFSLPKFRDNFTTDGLQDPDLAKELEEAIEKFQCVLDDEY